MSTRVCLAAIGVLLVVVAYLGAKAARARRTLRDVETHYGLRDPPHSVRTRPKGLPPWDLTKKRTYAEYHKQFELILAAAASEFDDGGASSAQSLARACRHALTGGKRIRPIVLLEVARAVNARRAADAHTDDEILFTPVDASEAAVLVEYLHAASLVIDDHPDFDNDASRRGAPSVHALTSPATAQMAALSLTAAAMQNVGRQVEWIRQNCPEIGNPDRITTRLCSLLGGALGAQGAAGGQSREKNTNGELSEAEIKSIITRKTARLFELAVVGGWIVAGGSPTHLDDMQVAGRHLGIAFQIADDIADAAKDSERGNAANFANAVGATAAVREVARNLAACKLALKNCGLMTPLWEEVFGMIRGTAAAPRTNTVPPSLPVPKKPSVTFGPNTVVAAAGNTERTDEPADNIADNAAEPN